VSRSPNRFRPTDAMSVAEAVFKPAPQPTPEPVVAKKRAGIPISKEQVSLKLDSDLLAPSRKTGPVGKSESTMRYEGQRVCKRAGMEARRAGDYSAARACGGGVNTKVTRQLPQRGHFMRSERSEIGMLPRVQTSASRSSSR